jgi:hypothetical protein
MTKSELLTKVFSEYFGRDVSELNAWTEKNMTDKVREKLDQPLPDDQAEKLLAEFRENPSAVMAMFADSFFGQ